MRKAATCCLSGANAREVIAIIGIISAFSDSSRSYVTAPHFRQMMTAAFMLALLDLFGLIDGADERRNKLASVTRFNGGLFDLKKAHQSRTGNR